MDAFVKAPRPGHGLIVALLAAMTSLTGCGGGGGGAAAPTPQPPPPPTPTSSTPIAAQLSVPPPVGYDAERLAAFNRLNEIRLSAGLGMLAQNVLMDRAAQAHAEWMVANDSFTHEEVAGTAGFTGTDWPLRDEAFGYAPLGGAEVIVAGTSGATAVDVLIDSVYHRSALLAFEPVDVGVGWSAGASASFSRPVAIDLTRPGTDTARGVGQAPQLRLHGVEIWPIDGAHDVPRGLGYEIPNPVPNRSVLSLGSPISVGVAASKTISVTAFSLTDTSLGTVVPTQVVTSRNDPNLLIPAYFVAMVPLSLLAPATSYKVVFSGTALERLSGSVETIDRSWSFTTTAH